MRDFVVMTDVNGDIDSSFATSEDICILPQYYHFDDGIIYGDEKKLSMEEFFSRLRAGERALSMGCNPKRVHDIMEEAVIAGKDILVLMASSECSGSYNTVVNEANDIMEEHGDATIKVIDTTFESIPIALLAYMAIDLKKEGKSLHEVYDIVEEKKKKMNIFFMIDHLDYLVRGGRLSPISGAIGTTLSIKPILHFENGQIVSFMKCRGKKAAKQAMIDELKKKKLDKRYFAAAHTLNFEEIEEFSEIVKNELGVEIRSITEVNPTIGVHVGDGAIAIAFCEE